MDSLDAGDYEIECEHGMVIYMGALTYVIGPLKVMGSKGSTDGTNYYRTN